MKDTIKYLVWIFAIVPFLIACGDSNTDDAPTDDFDVRFAETFHNGRRRQRRRTDLHGKGGEIPADYRFVPLGGGGNFLPLPHPQNIF